MRTAPYGSWKSPISSDLIVSESIQLSEARLYGGEAYWLERRPQERGRSVVVRPGRDLTPEPFNVRTRVHEYGGGAWTVSHGTLFFSHDLDQRLYRLDANASQPSPVTPAGSWRYGDGILDAQGRWIGVREDHTVGGREPVNELVAVTDSRVEVIAAGHDFFSSPKLSRNGRLAYLAWDHPRMPWDGTTLFLDGVAIAGGPEESIFEPEWEPDGSGLFFVSDRTGWWNIYRYDLATSTTRPVLSMAAEFGVPQWVLGLSTYAFAGPSRLVCSYIQNGLGHLATIDLLSGGFTPIPTPYTEFSSVRAEGDRVIFRGASAALPGSIVLMDLRTGHTEILKQSTKVADDPSLVRYFTGVTQIDYPSEGRVAHALHYPAFNPDYAGPQGEKPPLLVKVHGGPTSAASSALDLQIQYWTSRGISVLNVNYGGSTGYGRTYRQLLNGAWGIVDVDDCVNGARFLAAQGLADPARSVITGGSAGGYTTLAALTFRDYFRGGASHYGVSDIAVLARDTHKFESRYMDTLVGTAYRERSPIEHVDHLNAPVIFFQGDEDAIVPPNQTEMIVEALRAKGTPVGYLLFSGEQHGFRQAANIKRALDAELLFYAINVFRCGLSF
jgi:dienelactone hydrolase